MKQHHCPDHPEAADRHHWADGPLSACPHHQHQPNAIPIRYGRAARRKMDAEAGTVGIDRGHAQGGFISG